MFRFVSPIILSSMLVLCSTSSTVIAQAPKQDDAAKGADLFQQGRKYDLGLGAPINYAEAIRLYGEAAALNNQLAKAALARIYFNGSGVAVDKNEAAKWSKGTFPDVMKAAENNDAVAQNLLGSMYASGLGVARDGEEALKWFRKAADQNLAGAQANLGAAYALGVGVPRSDTEAAKWFGKAAAQGSAVAQTYLGDRYHAAKECRRTTSKPCGCIASAPRRTFHKPNATWALCTIMAAASS